MNFSKISLALLSMAAFLLSACAGNKKQALQLNQGESYTLQAELEYGRVLGEGYHVQHMVNANITTEFVPAESGITVGYKEVSIPVYENNFAKDLPEMEGLDEYVKNCLADEGKDLNSLEITNGSEFIARAYLDPFKIIDKHCLLLDGQKRCLTISDTIRSFVLEQVLSNIYPPANIVKKGVWEQEFSINPYNPEEKSTIKWSYQRDDKLGRYYYGKGNYSVQHMVETIYHDGEKIGEIPKSLWKGVIQLSLYIDPVTGWLNKGIIEWRQETDKVYPRKEFSPTSQTENLKVKFLPVKK